MQPHEAALHAAQAAQSAAVESRDALLAVLDMLERHDQPAQWERMKLTQIANVWMWQNHVEWPTYSFGIYNPTAINVYIGLGGSSGAPGAGVPIPPASLVVLPVAISSVEVGAAAADLAAGDAVLWGMRFRSVQPAFMEIF